MDELSREQSMQLLVEQPVGHLGVISEGIPYVTPVSYVIVGGAIGMRVAAGRRVDALKANPDACFETSVYDIESGAWQSVVVEGSVRFVSEGPEAEAVISELLGKYRSVVSAISGSSLSVGYETVAILEPRTITGRSSGSFFSLRTRPGRL